MKQLNTINRGQISSSKKMAVLLLYLQADISLKWQKTYISLGITTFLEKGEFWFEIDTKSEL